MALSISKTLLTMIVLCFVLATLMEVSSGYEHKVGGAQGWTMPNDTKTDMYSQWAEQTRFQVGDTLLFVYNSNTDSVLRVTKEHYDNCTTSMPMEHYNDGNTRFTLNNSGPYFFISAKRDRCQKGEKLHVVVMGVRGTKSKASAAPAPAPVKTSASSPAPTPVSVSVPALSPAPSPGPAMPPASNAAAVATLFQSGTMGVLVALLLCVSFA
uniref:TSA: Wollemia nobilis Ref_Wollemi_Transcript_7503_964 transcribed RNA sequence n=1 Tax=Wollemia nobilis TaxID=56998 RepID=A0A0C9RX32_9CONI